MSVLTKIFVVTLVVLSLILSAATITFVNSIDDYKRQMAASQTTIDQLTAQKAEIKNAADLQGKQSGDALAAANSQQAALTASVNDLNAKLADAGKEVANARSQATIAEANVSKLTSAVSALQTTNTAYQTQVTDLRTSSDRLLQQNGELNISNTDLSNKLAITEDARRAATEIVTELKGTNDKLSSALRDRGVDPNRVQSSGLAAGAPSINGIIRDTRSISGIPHAKISVGSEDSVKVGMEFNILDRSNGRFLGKLTVVAVEPNEAVGRITGPDIAAIAAGAEVRTQL